MTTPGPWAVSPTKHRTLIVSAQGFHVAAMEDASQDDAALMAAAPALLAALRIAREHVKAAAEADMCFARQQEQQHMYGNAAECRKQHDMRMCALSVIDEAITAAISQAQQGQQINEV